MTFDFDGSKSLAPKGDIAGYSWDFGDGESSPGGASARHTYALSARYVVTLTVTDGAGKEGSVARGVEVRLPECHLSPWTATDIGAPFFRGGACASKTGGCLEIAAGGASLANGRADQFHFVHRLAVRGRALARRQGFPECSRSASGKAPRSVPAASFSSTTPQCERHPSVAHSGL